MGINRQISVRLSVRVNVKLYLIRGLGEDADRSYLITIITHDIFFSVLIFSELAVAYKVEV